MIIAGIKLICVFAGFNICDNIENTAINGIPIENEKQNVRNDFLFNPELFSFSILLNPFLPIAIVFQE